MSNSSTHGPPRSSGLSLYANLLDPTSASTPGSIAKGPVVFKTGDSEEASAKKPQIDAATLRFQPTKRPQLSHKPKPKASFPKPAPSDNTAKDNSSAPSASVARLPVKSTLADWAVDDDVNDFYGGGEKRQRGGRKKKKQKREEYVAAQDWDDIYDPSRPNNYEEYKHSDEKIREVTEWKDRLYAHRKARRLPSDVDSDEDDYRPQMKNQFAPPPNYPFAPLPLEHASKPAPRDIPSSPPYSPTLATLPPPPPSVAQPSAPPEPVTAAAISRAPVRYNLPPPPSEIPSSEAELEKALAEEPDDEDDEEAPRSLRPGQKGFAERLMSKYGWSKGKGLGAEEAGIINPLRVQVEKRKKKSDAEGGGFRNTGGRGKIIGGKKNAAAEKPVEVGKFGPMSEVIVLQGMVDGMNLDEEFEGAGDGGLMQEIGDECTEKYGRVERVYIDRHGPPPSKVFVKFTSQLSALRASLPIVCLCPYINIVQRL